jgi:predicted dehydrogenase
MLDDVACDAAVVCTPPATHPEISIHCLERGAGVLCEKPLAIDSQNARRMFDAAARHKRLLTMASKFRFVEDVVRAKALVTSGIIGDVVLFENTFTSRVEMSARWNSNPQQSGGGVLIDNGTHSVDLMRYFFGPLADLKAVELKRIQGLAVEDTVRIFVRTEGGVMGSIDLSWTINKEQPYYLSIYGSAGTILVGWKESKYRRTKDADWTVFGRGYDKLQAFGRQIDNFSRAIRGDEPLVVTPQDAMASVEAIEAGYEALRRSRWQPVQPSRGNGRRMAAVATGHGNGGGP